MFPSDIIDSEEEFTGDGDRPVVFRRRRLQRQVGGRFRRGDTWSTFDDERLAVPFALVERGDRVEIDTDALGDGLVVVPRESIGTAADLDEAAMRSAPVDLSPETPVRLRIEQVSSVDHATAAGVPTRDAAGATSLGPGLGRPLILTTLDPDEAMRVLASSQRRSLLVASGLLVAAPIVVLAGLVIALVGV